MSFTKKMVPIPISEFMSGGAIPVNVYIKLSNEKYVLIAKEGSKTSINQMRTFEKQTVDTLYVEDAEYHRLVAQNITIADMVISRSDITQSKKADFLIKSSASVMKQIEHFGFTRDSFENAKQVSQKTTMLIEAKPELYHIMHSLSSISDDILSHSVGTSAVSVMIGKMLGWTFKGTFEKVSLGGLLHDIGLRQIPKEILNKPKAYYTIEEFHAYESHPFKGMELLRTITNVPDDVVAIAYEHHENSIGQGYPRKLRDVRLNPLSKIVIMADAFVELTLPTHGLPGKSPEEALEYIERVLGQPFNKDAFQALKMLVKTSTKVPLKKSDDDSDSDAA